MFSRFLFFLLIICLNNLSCHAADQSSINIHDAGVRDSNNCVTEQRESGLPMIACSCSLATDDVDCGLLVDTPLWQSQYCSFFSRCLLHDEDDCFAFSGIFSGQGADAGSEDVDENSNPCTGSSSFSLYFFGRTACLNELQRLGFCLDGIEDCDPCDLSARENN